MREVYVHDIKCVSQSTIRLGAFRYDFKIHNHVGFKIKSLGFKIKSVVKSS